MNSQVIVSKIEPSNASNAQVREIITKVKPDRVMVELCEERRGLMYQSETATQNISWDDIKKVIKEKGYGQAMMLLPLLFASSEVIIDIICIFMCIGRSTIFLSLKLSL